MNDLPAPLAEPRIPARGGVIDKDSISTLGFLPYPIIFASMNHARSTAHVFRCLSVEHF